MSVVLKGFLSSQVLTKGYGLREGAWLGPVFHPEASLSKLGGMVSIPSRHGALTGSRQGSRVFQRFVR